MSAWAWPQYVVLGMLVFRVVFGMGMHGKPKDGNWNAGEVAGITLVWAWVFWMGGFWG